LRTDLTSEQKEYMEMINASADSLLVILNDILDLSKIESGKLELEKVTFDLNKLIDNTCTFMDLKAKQKNLRVNYKIKEDTCLIFLGDPHRIKQILINLIGNSIKFTEKGSIDVYVQLISQKNDIAELEFRISDTGIGIAKDRIGKIFDSFTQADDSTTRKFGGTGLGTSISKQLVELMGGKIWVESELSKGSNFFFTIKLPKVDCAQIKEDSIVYDELIEAVIENVDSKSLKILLVEDNEINRAYIKAMFKDGENIIIEAVDGVDGLNKWEEDNFDLILLDDQMPEMDGKSVAKIIRDKEKNTNKHIPIIALTANAMPGAKEIYLSAGMDMYLTKPLKRGKLFQAINSLVTPSGDDNADNIDSVDSNYDNVFSREQLAENILGDKTLGRDPIINEILDVYLKEYKEIISRLEESIQRKNYEEIRELGHAMKGAAGNITAMNLHALFHEVELAGKEKKIESIENILKQIKKEYNLLISMI
jgi:CheY-like chemotaxis protein/HPt (histidine-containing phosphotransfer) domain-containing protein